MLLRLARAAVADELCAVAARSTSKPDPCPGQPFFTFTFHVDEDEHLMLIDDGHVRDRSDLHLISHSGLLAQEEELRKSTAIQNLN
jgi:hypothetical protein